MNQNILLLAGLAIGIFIKLGNLRNVAKLISSKDAKKMISNNEFNIILDVRSKEEYLNGHYPNAINIPYDKIDEKILDKINKESNILIYCRSGRRAEIAANKINNLGYKNIFYIKGSYELLK